MRATLATLLSNSSKCYYESLDVPQDAELKDIKKKFRELSKTHHPDVATQGCPERNAEKFKEISNAYQTLSNPKERRRYDLEREDRNWYRNRHHGGQAGTGYAGYGFSSNNTNNMRPPPKGPKATGAYAVVETMFKPRNFIVGMALCMGASAVYGFIFQDENDKQKQQLMMMQANHRHQGNRQLVEAWKNPKTGKWEQAAPWDPTYQRLQPTLEMVPRDQVHKRTR